MHFEVHTRQNTVNGKLSCALQVADIKADSALMSGRCCRLGSVMSFHVPGNVPGNDASLMTPHQRKLYGSTTARHDAFLCQRLVPKNSTRSCDASACLMGKEECLRDVQCIALGHLIAGNIGANTCCQQHGT